MEPNSVRRHVGWFCLFLVCQLAFNWLNAYHEEQQTIFGEYQSLARYFTGVEHREILTYPMWGYAHILNLIPDDSWIVPIQGLVGAATLTLVHAAVRRRKQLPWSATLICVAAVPWYALHSVRWPASLAASGLVLTLFVLAAAIRRHDMRLAAASGIGFGVVLNLRSETLLFLVGLVVTFAFVRLRSRSTAAHLRLSLVAALIGLSCMVPWAMHYKQSTGSYSFSSSNGGMVAVISLGQLPANPWGAIHEDAYAAAVLTEIGSAAAPTSHEGHVLLRERFAASVREAPLAFTQKVLFNTLRTFAGGMYVGEPGTRLALSDRVQLRQVTASLKAGEVGEVLAARPIVAVIVVSVLIAKLGSIAVLLSAGLGMLARWNIWMRDPLLFLFAILIIYQLSLMAMLQSEPRHLNGLYPALAPFVLLAVERAVRSSRTRAGTANRASPDLASVSR